MGMDPVTIGLVTAAVVGTGATAYSAMNQPKGMGGLDAGEMEARAKDKTSEDARRRAKARNRNETVFTSPTGTAKPTVFKKKLGT